MMVKIKTAELDLALINKLEQMVFGASRITAEKLEQIITKQAVLLVAYRSEQPIGFKLGYQIPETLIFFSWLGGVHPEYRRQGIAQHLLDRQEYIVRKLALKKIYFTSFDRFSGMIRLGQINGYHLTRTALDNGERKYWFEKQL